MLNLERLLQVPHVEPYTGFSISPDGTQVAFSWNQTGRWELYCLALDGSGHARMVTHGPGAKFAPQWSPDGRQLLYALDLDGGELYDLICWQPDADGGEHRNLTPETPDAILPGFRWSPDGRQIAFISDRGGTFDTYVMPAGGGPARPVLSLPSPDLQVRWSPDGQWLAVVTEGKVQQWRAIIVPADGGAPRPIEAGGAGDGPLCAREVCWSPDGRQIAFASDQGGRWQIGLYELASGRVTWLEGGEGDQESPTWSPDGRQLACVGRQGPRTWVAVLDLASASHVAYEVGAGVHHAPSFTPDGERLVVVFDNPAHPGDLWLLSLADGGWQPLTRSRPPDLAEDDFVMPSEVWYPSLDGVSVPALLYQSPSSSDLPPAVVTIHGGPTWLTQVTWDPFVQHLVSRGWTVLAPNYRGSTGYGRAWQLSNRFDLGGVDTRDVVSGADYLVGQGLADPRRVAVTGRSWGGYLTMTCLTGYPDRWAVGAAVVPFLNWFTGHANSRVDLQHWDRENFGDPEQDRELWYERSPFFFLDRVQAPVQLICGEHDPRCPASESTQAAEQLAALGKACDLILYPDEGHAFLQTENVVDAELRRVAFLAQVLQGPGSDSPEEA
jgi:dipeptidyl aminopeptidase/acylaminoacyl peptidase